MKRIIVALAFLLGFAGCAVTPEFPAPDDQWDTFTGQLHYLSPKRSLVGEFTAARYGREFRLDYSKGAAFPLLKLSHHGELLRAEGPLARGRWQGRAEAAPPHLRGWVRIPARFAALQMNPASSRTEILTLPGANAGEKFTFRFNR
jgi:hypothetical protein